MSVKFLGRINASINGCMKRSAIFFVSEKNGQIISKDVFKVLKSRVIGSDNGTFLWSVFSLYCKRVCLSFLTILSIADWTV